MARLANQKTCNISYVKGGCTFNSVCDYNKFLAQAHSLRFLLIHTYLHNTNTCLLMYLCMYVCIHTHTRQATLANGKCWLLWCVTRICHPRNPALPLSSAFPHIKSKLYECFLFSCFDFINYAEERSTNKLLRISICANAFRLWHIYAWVVAHTRAYMHTYMHIRWFVLLFFYFLGCVSANAYNDICHYVTHLLQPTAGYWLFCCCCCCCCCPLLLP